MASSQQWRLPEEERSLADALKRAGSKSTINRSSVEDLVLSIGRDRLTDLEVAHAILWILSTPQNAQYNLHEFIAALKPNKSLKWNNIVHNFDVPRFNITTENFSRLFNSLLQIATEDQRFDISRIWGGVWQNPATQVSFLRQFLLSKDIKPEKVPGLRESLDLKQFEGLPQQTISQIASKFNSPYNSLDAIQAILEVCLASDEMTEELNSNAILTDLVKHHMDTFILTLYQLPRQLQPTQESFIERCFMMYLERYNQNSHLVLEALFKQDPTFTNSLCTLCFQGDPRRTQIILERAEELGWIDVFLTAVDTPLALDLACLRHKLREDFDLDKYLSKVIATKSQAERTQYGQTLWKYLRIKADAEFRMQRGQHAPESVPLNLSSVFILLWKLMELVTDREFLKNAQNTCIVTYPRLVNFGTGFDQILERRSSDQGNKLLDETDERMSELFGQMYRSELSIRDLVSEMRVYKSSTNPDMQDLFCCIIHGLFDEYLCYSEYPEEALEKTALLFGSIINYRLLPPIPEQYGLALILDAVKDNPENSNMHRFGVEALLQISDRLPEWPKSCQLLLQISSLSNPEIILKAREGIRSQSGRQNANDLTDAFSASNGAQDEAGKDLSYRPFQSIRADLPSAEEQFRDPDEKAQEKILFAINNLSMDNMSTKLSDLQEVLKPEHHQWFASYLVEQRARLEPNNQQMYFDLLSMLSDDHLMAEVLRETFVSVTKMINAKSTVDSAVERSHLKSLGGWLGSLTLAQNKPIKHRNIYFIDLLLEGFDTQRLVVVIPFTCKVLVQGSRSLIFKPPNPWLMEIVRLLLELYHFAELKLNLKFEIEVLCKDLALDYKKIEPAIIIRERPQQAEEDLIDPTGIAEGLEGFDELALNGPMSRGVRERISPQDIMATLPNLREMLRYPQLQGEPGQQMLVRDMFTRAFEQAILEIIAPVVERSITIASISTAQLVAKDYALEIDVDRYRMAARQMVKSLAGSLALVTCKEPLRMSVSNYIRKALENDRDLGEAMPSEGHIMMALNDNLDVACSFVEQAAEDRSIPEIDHVIEQEVEDRQRFASEHPERDYYNPNVSRWSTFIAEPYKQVVGGLNEPQRAVYEDFDRRVRGMNAGHVQNASMDSTGRQIPDVLQDTLAMPSLSTPANQPAIPHQSPMAQPQEVRSMSALQQPRMNGYSDMVPPHEKIGMLIDDVQKASRTSNARRLKDVEKNSSIFHDVRQILIILTSSARPIADHMARQIAEKICHTFVIKPPQNLLEAELLAFLLNKLCMLSELISRDVMRWTTANEDALLGSINITVALTCVGLMDLNRIDGVIATALKEHNEHGLQLLAELMEQTLFGEEPMAFRADFANSIIALYAWLKEQSDLPLALELSTKLKARGIPEYVSVILNDKAKAKQDQMQYVFKEWVALTENVAYNEVTFARFIRDIHHDQLLSDSEDLANFLRIAVTACIECFDSEAQSFRGSLTTAFSRTDALAQLVILILKFQGNDDGAVKQTKAANFESILNMIVLVLNHHHELHLVAFNQRVFTRLFNSMLFEYAELHLESDPEHNDLTACLAQTLLALTPRIFSNFAYGWFTLVSHRVLVYNLLRSGSDKLHGLYRNLMGNAFEFLSSMTDDDLLRQHFDAFYRALLRTVYVIRNDYPDFLSENYVYLCARLPYQAPQLRNLVLSSKPATEREAPDPTKNGLKLERLGEMRQIPIVAIDVNEPLERIGLLANLSTLSRKPENVEITIKQFADAIAHEGQLPEASSSRLPIDLELYEHIVAWIVMEGAAGGKRFDENSPHVRLCVKVVRNASHAGRYYLASAIADQLRFPNAYTEYAQKLFLHLWGTGTASDLEAAALRETLFRVLVERIINARPHPWGLIVTFIELSSVPAYEFDQNAGLTQNSELSQRLQVAIRGH